jgi:hypothetical protein
MHRYIETTRRTLYDTLNDKGIPGQLGRALFSRQLCMHGMADASITKTSWAKLRSPWLRKQKLLIDSGTGMRPSGLHGILEKDENILVTLLR